MPPHSYSLTVQFEDVDSYGIVHHTRLIAYCERARVDFFARHLAVPPTEMPQLLVYRLSSRFVRPARLLDTVAITMVCDQLNAARFSLRYRLQRAEQLLCSVTTVMCCREQSGTLLTLPPALCALLQECRV
jgi:YbgC/YbaW family acyl-CoA thioester hydrolase